MRARSHVATPLVLVMLCFGLTTGAVATAQRAEPRPEPKPTEPRPEPRPAPPHPGQPHRPVHVGATIFIGGYFYDPGFGPYPWWQRPVYPYPYFPLYAPSAQVRVMVTPKNAGVYVDGFYAGIVDDFNGFFQRLTLAPGGHEIVLFLEGYRTLRERLYLAPGSTFKLELTMEPLAPGDRSEPPDVAPPAPPPPDGTFIRPRTPAPPAPPPAPIVRAAVLGTLSLRVQPANATVMIDGERWMSADGQRFVIELGAGLHHIEVTRAGYAPFTTDVPVQDGETLALNVTLSKQP